MKKRIAWAGCVIPSCCFLAGCAAPFSDLQSARTVGKGRVEVTGSYSAVSLNSEGDSERLQDHTGVQLAIGVSDGVDLRTRYERISFHDADRGGINVLGFGTEVLAPSGV